jgi:hypothetical protein
MTRQSWIEAAQLARDNARTLRRRARVWGDAGRAEWADDLTYEAHRAFNRAYWYLARARMAP